jgi:hypothetical protein
VFANIKIIKQNNGIMTANASEKRKLPRFHITPCQFHDNGIKKNFSVQDVSLGGLAIRLVDRADLPLFAVATEHQGILKIEGLKLPCSFQVRYIRGSLIGGEWVNLNDALKNHLDQISSPKHLGESLKAYDIPDSSDTIWYHNPTGVDLLLYLTEGKISRWTLYIHHSFISWEQDGAVRTGRALAEDEEGYAHGIVRVETRLIDYDPQADHRLIETAIELIKSAAIKEESTRQLILNHLKGSL